MPKVSSAVVILLSVLLIFLLNTQCEIIKGDYSDDQLNPIDEVKKDYHVFYNSTTWVDEVQVDKYLKDFENFTIITLNTNANHREKIFQLSFDFPFYGQVIRNVSIAMDGFLNPGEYVHSWYRGTRYIAPLLAGFETSWSLDSYVKYKDNGTAFTVIWENVILQDHPDFEKLTFSVSLFNSGDIMFAYYSVPVLIETIHLAKVGLSDAYVYKTNLSAGSKIFNEYHHVNFDTEVIRNGTIIYLNSLKTCLSATDCEACVSNFPLQSCTWCPALNWCSSGMDYRHEEWIQKSCDRISLTTCPAAIGDRGNNAAAQDNQA